MSKTSERIIVPLDTDVVSAQGIVGDLTDTGVIFKVGYDLCFNESPCRACHIAGEYGDRVMLDLKLADIGKTNMKALKAFSHYDVPIWGITIRADIANDSIAEMVDAIGEYLPDALLIAVTVLTDIGPAEAKSTYNCFSHDLAVQWLVNKAVAHGAPAVVLSPQDLEHENVAAAAFDAYKICPGIRPEWAAADGQVRFTTPAEAVELGADYMVIGSPIITPPEEVGQPIDAVERIVAEVDASRVDA